MARSRRPHLPGAPFHLTARLQGRVPRFLGLQPVVARWIKEDAARASCDILAFAVMPNHLHLVVVQGALPLSHFMQPLLRRIAIRVHAQHGSEGHVFQRRYHSSPCADPDYLRDVIAYVHLNPVRARLCETPEQYAWTTHADYCSAPSERSAQRGGAASGLRLFAPEPGAKLNSCLDSYLRFLSWRTLADANARPTRSRRQLIELQRPATTGGDAYWAERYGWHCTPCAENERPRKPALDLRDLAIKVLREIEPELSLELLRSGARTRPLVAVRRQFILRAKENGHRNRSIARFLRVSDVTVSNT